MERLFKSKDIDERRADAIIECVNCFYRTHGVCETYRFDVIRQFLNISEAAFLTYAMFVTMCSIGYIDSYSEMAKTSIYLMRKTQKEIWDLQEQCFKSFWRNTRSDIENGTPESIIIEKCADCCIGWLIKELELHEVPCYQNENAVVRTSMNELKQKLIGELDKIY